MVNRALFIREEYPMTMSKSKLYFSNCKDEADYRILLKHFQLDDLLKNISKESVDIFKRDCSQVCCGTKCASFPIMTNLTTGLTFKQDVIVTAWRLVDLAYEAILTTNDYRGKHIEKEDEIYLLHLATDEYYGKKEKDIIDCILSSDMTKFMFYLHGFSGEQFKFENANSSIINAFRELYILFESSKSVSSANYDISDIVVKETGANWEAVVGVLFLLWSGSTEFSEIQKIDNLLEWPENFTKDNFYQIVSRYTATYDEIRNSDLGRQIFYTKPFIKTSRNEIISINCFLNLFLYEHAIMWIVRDYYKKQNNQGFTSYFGECFEEYFRELLSTFLSADEYEKIPEENARKRADWKLFLDGYKFLIEQKSTFLRLSAKQQDSDFPAIENFTKDTIIKAIGQLQTTEDDFNEGKFIKVILLYDDYLNTHILEEAFKLECCNAKNDNYYWIVTIDEAEMLLSTYASDRKRFRMIVSEKIKREEIHSKDARDLTNIMIQFGITDNTYLESDKFSYYKEIASQTAISYLKKSNTETINPL